MLKGKNVALFIDVDNCSLNFSHFDNAVNYIKESNNLIYGKAYGVSDKKNKEIIEATTKLGFDTACPLIKAKRSTKLLDNRIIIDVLDTVLSLNHIDTVCIIAAPADMVYFYSKLRAYDISIMALDNVDDDSLAFVDDIIDIGYVEAIKPVKKAKKAVEKTVKPAEQKTPTSIPEGAEEAREADFIDKVNTAEEEIKKQAEEDAPYFDDEPLVEREEDADKSEEADDVPLINVMEREEEEDAQILRQIEKVKMTQKAAANDDEQLLSEIKRLLAEFNKENE